MQMMRKFESFLVVTFEANLLDRVKGDTNKLTRYVIAWCICAEADVSGNEIRTFLLFCLSVLPQRQTYVTLVQLKSDPGNDLIWSLFLCDSLRPT